MSLLRNFKNIKQQYNTRRTTQKENWRLIETYKYSTV